MANLLGQNIGTNYKGILNLNTLNGNLSGTLQAVTDGDGNASPLQLSTTNVAMTFADTSGLFYGPYSTGGVYSGIWDNKIAVKNTTNFSLLSGNGETYLNSASGGLFFSINGPSTPLMNLTTSGFAIGQSTTAASARLHVRGDGTNDIILLQNGAGTATRFKVDNDGNCTGIDGFFASYASFASGSNGVKVGGGLRIKNPNDGEMLLQNDSANDFSKIHFGTTSKPAVCQGAGTPEGAVAAPVGSIFMRSDGGAGTSFYVKESGTGNTGWVAK
jgi:hypothetical protein